MDIRVATVRGPWGPIQAAVSDLAIVGIAVLAPTEAFASEVVRRTGGDVVPGSSVLLDRAIGAIEAFVDGQPDGLASLPVDLVRAGAWGPDRAGCGPWPGLG